MDICAVLTGARCQSCGSQTHQKNDCWYKDETCKTGGNRRYLAKLCRHGNAQTPTHGSSQVTGKGPGKGSSKSQGQGQGQGQGKGEGEGEGEGKGKKRTPGTCLCCGKEGTQEKEIANSRLRHVQTVERLVT